MVSFQKKAYSALMREKMKNVPMVFNSTLLETSFEVGTSGTSEVLLNVKTSSAKIKFSANLIAGFKHQLLAIVGRNK